MNPRVVFASMVLFAISALTGFAADEDSIAKQLLKDKEAFAAAQAKAKEDALKEFDAYYEKVKGNKALKIEAQLAQLEKIEAERKAFDESGVSSSLPGLKVAMSEYRTAQKKAEQQCKQAFEAAAKAYRDKGEVKAAVAVLDEMKEFLAKTPGEAAAAVIACGNSDKVLGLKGGSTDDGTKVVTADFAKGDATQLWKVVPAGSDWVYVENVKSGLVVTCNGEGNGTEVVISKKAQPPSDSQLWKLTPVGKEKDVVKVFAKASNKLIGVDAKSKDAGARILLWTDAKTEACQMFVFTTPK